ncbi:hypothetical protein [Nonomuraea glycinis]|jgi:unsaturated chondroitin disaccharide hydrolase|uniref:hypothetical protein n=1 Tax=Nonomuraea glycinis TaxID=2047744 RepID=UPI002E13E940|nr:hypothetical protein OHA68_28355 [Nonomuraea glycinis]
MSRWAERALNAILRRVTETEDQCGNRWPLYADPDSALWTTTGRGSWTGGFWAGLLWLRATVSADPRHTAVACERTEALAPWVDADTATRGMIFWYATALAEGAEELRRRTALACLNAHDPELGLVPWGSAFGGPRLLARVDALPGLVRLLPEGGPAGAAAADAHVALQLGLTTSAGAHPSWIAVPGGGWSPYPEPGPGWSRTVAWLALAVADHAQVSPAGPVLLHCLCGWSGFTARFANGAPIVPPASAVRPQGPADTSAAAIEAVAALKLAALTGEDRWRDRATEVLRVLVTDHLRDGRLLDGCYDLAHGVATSHELVWGDFFLALALAMLIGVIDPFAC